MPRIEGSAVDRSPDTVQKGYGQPWDQLLRARFELIVVCGRVSKPRLTEW
jgi:hypothetical protein